MDLTGVLLTMCTALAVVLAYRYWFVNQNIDGPNGGIGNDLVHLLLILSVANVELHLIGMRSPYMGWPVHALQLDGSLQTLDDGRRRRGPRR